MITASAVGLAATPDQVFQARVVAIYDHHGQPIALFVSRSDTVVEVFSLAMDEAEFKTAVEQYGIKHQADVCRRTY